MSENHDEHEGPIHQAFWVFPVTVVSSYAFLMLVMAAKWTTPEVDTPTFFKVFGIQAAIFAVFLIIFSGIIVLSAKLLGAMGEQEEESN